MEIVGAVISMIQCFCGETCSHQSISEKCMYMRKPHALANRIEEKMELLKAREEDVRRKLQVEKVWRGMEPKAEVNMWLTNVGKIKSSVACLQEEITKNKSCLNGCCPNYTSRLKLGKHFNKKIKEADRLLAQSIYPDASLVDMMPQRGNILPATSLVGETAQRSLKLVWEYLNDGHTGIIGIYGMGGVGKTSILVAINNRLLRESTAFDNVIWVTASKDSNVQKLQKDIARAVCLSFDEEDDEMARAAQLLEALMRRRRFLLIIDDLWEAFSLEVVGIPSPGYGHECKLIITTRSMMVCRGMETMRDVEVSVLSKEEAYDLFKQKVGDEVLASPRLQAVAEDVAMECGGLPLALVTVGRALRRENDMRQWENALSQLKSAMGRIEGMENRVFTRLRFSYERLKDNVTRSCFLYCALYPEDHHIETEELIKYWIWEGMLDNLGYGESKMLQGKMILDELKNACLLEIGCQEGSLNEFVKMHDLIRDMAIAVTRVNPLFMIRAGSGIRVPPVENEWLVGLERISLMRNDLSTLSFEPRCPQLTTLLLQYNSLSKGILPSFFNHLGSLKVLDLSYTGIARLPESLSNLENLHALLLRSCWNLRYVPTMERLKELRVLDLSSTSIECTPQGMEMLLNLKHLDLSYTTVDGFDIRILGTFRFLEDLLTIGLWQPLMFGLDFVNVVASCTNLANLEANFSTLHDFNRYVLSGHWSMLESFKFCLGYPQSSKLPGKNSVGFFGIHIVEMEAPSWLPTILELAVHECSGITHLPMFIMNASSHLKHCKIKYCDEMEWIITSEWGTFPELELLEIEGLSRLQNICKGIPPAGTLSTLKVLNVTACDNLTTLLPLELVQQLNNLEEIELRSCLMLEEIVTEAESEEVIQENDNEVVLPSLQKLRLVSIPRLRSICRGPMICDSLTTIEVIDCPELEIIPFFLEIRQQLADSLKQIKGSRRWWWTLERNHPIATSLLAPLFKPESAPNEDIRVDSNTINSYGGSSGSSSFGPR
ncbi:disease resistance protein At4g27190 [Nicotiana tabacum]|uniref:Disease resistance protein RPS2 n=3 Tax=Nicotiana TaxID=4085 RepID=A0A1S4AZW8_TOBAC|nr:PREDICTED: disease resistance protein RPS2-like [Nicotiana sylvestris]XP_009779925.1 PREDICTED: disease resistance protein RPS2-like [Nicotiana sylvestris]XP_016482243.1 PREDICTED: disease resistance protein RPS2-like [Nicotiana tabacum]XP_016482244.1 PREDICTED: disease resistance protein RPS2-like [Nicotiana tabacum]XP_016482245.1 PREDICTED: disease resistance protein RPS2-like [Nicotiana tabacum]